MSELFCAFILIGASLSSFNARATEDPNWEGVGAETKAACEKVKGLKVPVSDRPPADAAKTLSGCDEEELYYGFTNAPDYVKARQCSILSDYFPLLTMIYANGKGVPVNLDLALHFACEMGGAPAEIEGRVDHLLSLKKNPPKDLNFDYCDDITSGSMMGMCAAKSERFEAAQRKNKLASVVANWSATDRTGFDVLKTAAKAFAEARSRNEIDLSGTARGAFVTAEEDIQERDFLESLDKLENNKAPSYSSEQFKTEDKLLNTLYVKLMKKKSAKGEEPGTIGYGTVTKSGVKETQVAWIKYRDAWVTFAKLKYPKVSSDSISAWFTKKRNHMLRSISS